MRGRDAAEAPVAVWFRNDLRLGDHPALQAAIPTGRPVLCLYVHDEESFGLRPLGGASRWWLHHALAALAKSLADVGARLDVFRGPAATVVPEVLTSAGATACFWSRRYGAAEIAVDRAVAAALEQRKVAVETSNATLLHEPTEVRSKAGGPFKVFTPYRRAALALGPPGLPLPAPDRIRPAAALPKGAKTVSIAQLGLLPKNPDWSGGIAQTWTPGEPAAQSLLESFLAQGLTRYGEDRDRPALAGTSRLSPHLHFGALSPRQVLARVQHAAESGAVPEAQADKFVSEVLWRDFAYNLLAQHPALATEPVQPLFRAFPYRSASRAELDAWRFGRTGYPMVDAGMRQLWRTGTMANRARMITASFLTKHLLVDWRVGEAWFWDTLVDADPASNPVNWQWVAGSGADPAPFFRIFNPVSQGERFDPNGDYIRRHVPELGSLPARFIHQPWTAPKPVLDEAGIKLGETYPMPIVEHGEARSRALAALAGARDRASTQSPNQ